MVITIGICDDNPDQVQLLMQYMNSYNGEDEFIIVEATRPEDFLLKMGLCKPQLVFLDIGMDEMDGIQLGDKIRTLYENTVIVYITAYEEYALEAFRVRAFHYLLKPLTREKFNHVLEEAVKYIKKDSGSKPVKIFTVRTKREIISINYNDIWYFEKIGHKVKINTENRNIYYYENFYTLLEKLDSDSFIQCHQGYIANVDKIRGFRERTLILDRDRQLPVSRSFVESIKEMLAKRLFAGKDEI